MSGLQTQYLALAIILISIGIIAWLKVGAYWLRLTLITLLAVMVTIRIDKIGLYFGVDYISQDVSDLLTFFAISVIDLAFVAAYRRRRYLARAEEQRQMDFYYRHGSKIERLEEIRLRDEERHRKSWSTITPLSVKETVEVVNLRNG